jgi:hypothetical protein
MVDPAVGTRTDRDRLRRATQQVDAYLVGILQSALVLTHPIARLPEPR